jgi:hypothetical protein
MHRVYQTLHCLTKQFSCVYRKEQEPQLSPINHQNSAPRCPKCGYDQSGAIATWEAKCPLDGQCPECGYAFSWCRVFAILEEWGSEVRWNVEHAHSLIGMIKRTPGTLAHLVFPSRYFRVMNHRRAVRPLSLLLWLPILMLLTHLAVSPIGYAAHGVEGYAYSGRGGHGSVADFIEIQMTELPSAVLFPFKFLTYDANGWSLSPGPFSGYEWADYMKLAWVFIGAPMFWIGLIAFVLLTRHVEHKDYRVELLQLARFLLLSLIPVVLYIQYVRLGFGIHAATGMTAATNWVPISYVASALVFLFWQQLLWTHAVRRIWHIRRSFFINIIGSFASVFTGIMFFLYIL